VRRHRRNAIAALALVTVVSSACADAPESKAAPRVVPTPSPSQSVVINPPGILVENVAFGRSKQRVRAAVRDLEAAGLWHRLTRHLYRVKFGTRLGVVNIPDDGHLADAVLTAAFDEGAQGRLCDILFFPNAIDQDLRRWHLYYSQGAIEDPPPTLRQYWGGVMAHELGHCFPGGPGEKVARAWEAKALRRLRELRR
jgi:hypothetical protein